MLGSSRLSGCFAGHSGNRDEAAAADLGDAVELGDLRGAAVAGRGVGGVGRCVGFVGGVAGGLGVAVVGGLDEDLVDVPLCVVVGKTRVAMSLARRRLSRSWRRRRSRRRSEGLFAAVVRVDAVAGPS